MADLTPIQCREARNLLRWSRDRLAARAGMTITTLIRIETEKANLLQSDVAALRTVFEEAGVEFILNDNGASVVRIKSADVVV